MNDKKIKVPAFETVYKKLDDYYKVIDAKNHGYNKNEMRPTTVYNAFSDEIKEIKRANGTLDAAKYDFLEKSYRHTAQQRELKFDSGNKEFLRGIYNTFLSDDMQLLKDSLTEAMKQRSNAPTKTKTKSQSLSM
jgi:hypothetical protein